MARMIEAAVWAIVAAFVALAPASAAEPESAPALPMRDTGRHAAETRWLAKPVLQSRLLDDMEAATNWSHHGPGEMSFMPERCRDGLQSIRLKSRTIADKPNAAAGRPFGEAVLRRSFDKEDWSDFNRLSVWVYPTMKGFGVGSVLLKLGNEGDGKLMGPWVRGAMNHVLVTPGRWNHVVWEIAHLPRDKVMSLELIYRLQGNEPGAAATVWFDFDHLELQRVEADCFAGWAVAPGRIAFCHSGYLTGSPKIAIAGDLKAGQFSVADAKTGRAVLTRPVRTTKTDLGEFGLLDFTELEQPGEYVLRAGQVETGAFRIGPDVWRGTIEKSVNFFRCQRCGAQVPGMHGVCHGDLHADHAGRRIISNGGWHDAGDLSQGVINTAEAVHAMLTLAERRREGDRELADRLIDEAVWGLQWLHKTRFGDGARVVWQTMDFWSDGAAGNVDDVAAQVADSPYENLMAARASALAARMLRDSHPDLARQALEVAEADWRFALAKLKPDQMEHAAEAALAGVELYRATGSRAYADKAVELARTVTASQQQVLADWDKPLCGFFHHSPRRQRIVNYFHRGHDQAPAVALAELCHALPDHPDWMQWYAAVVLHSEYQRAAAAFNRPYETLPAGVYRLADNPAEVSLGVRLSKTHCLRRFPVVGEWRGHFGVLLSQTKALSAAARLRRDGGLMDLCQAQLQWVIGRNPFAQSTMTGEGYDYTPLYTPMIGNVVGALPVGIQYRAGTDEPFWPPSNCWVYKEVWVHPVARWLWIMGDLAGRREPDLPEACSFTLSSEAAPEGQVAIKLTATGRGRHRFALRAWNLDVADAAREIDLAEGRPAVLTWRGKVIAADTPWVVVACPDGSLAGRKDLTGRPR